jgi:hypothetical protein
VGEAMRATVRARPAQIESATRASASVHVLPSYDHEQSWLGPREVRSAKCKVR